ncbi:hypothetical protein IW150_006813, partial [Coemansia sp. RSA 2607]
PVRLRLRRPGAGPRAHSHARAPLHRLAGRRRPHLGNHRSLPRPRRRRPHSLVGPGQCRRPLGSFQQPLCARTRPASQRLCAAAAAHRPCRHRPRPCCSGERHCPDRQKLHCRV